MTDTASLDPISEQEAPRVRTSLYDLTRDQLAHQLADWHEPDFRLSQIWRWIYERHVPDIDSMSDLSKDLRARLKERFTLSRLSTAAESQSSDGWTRKWLLKLADGSEVETVLMEYDGIRRTACISSQAGCAMNCSFCATGQMGFLRNLRAGEIIEQVIWVARALAAADTFTTSSANETRYKNVERLSNVVFMGMGEPFANYQNVMEAAHRLVESKDAGGFGLGARKITISTVGLVPGIQKFAHEGLQLNLAVSLHAATDELRSQLVPISRRYPLRELSHAVHDYIQKTNRRVSFEWALIDSTNDTPEQAEALVKFVRNTFDPESERRHMIHINMIPLNPTSGYAGKASQRSRIQHFCDVLNAAGIPNTLRVRRGIDINAGCGQLKAAAHE
jgi:23S rRNA (adenine2503-C2)-methyltransferase